MIRPASLLPVLLLVSVALADAPPRAVEGGLTIVVDGKSDYRIVLPPDATPAERRAADDLAEYLHRMTGARLPVATAEAGRAPERAIVLGPDPSMGDLGPEGFTLRTVGQRLVIAGGRPRGTLYGVQAFLESLGVRWFTPKVTRVPTRPTIIVPPANRTETPAFEYREIYFTEALDPAWAPRLRVNGSHVPADETSGGKIVYAQFVHTFDTLVPPALYELHPEYFPLIGGKRVGGYVQRCLSNPDVLRLSVAGVEKMFDQNPAASITSVSQNDVDKWCECEACAAVAARYGGKQSGLYLWFANRVAEEVEKKHPGKLIDTLAYQFTEPAPTGITPRHNVRVRVCPIAVCLGHPYEGDDYPPSRAFLAALGDWSKLTDQLYVWHYGIDFAHYQQPFPDFGQFPTSIRLYERSGVKGVFFQGCYPPAAAGSFAELRSYVVAKLLWNPDQDERTLIEEWTAGVYGPAAGPMLEWFDLLHQTVAERRDRHFNCFAPAPAEYLTQDVLDKGDALFDQARRLAAADPAAGEYVERARLGLRYAKLLRTKPAEADLRAFLADVRRHGLGQLREGVTIEWWEQRYRESAPGR